MPKSSRALLLVAAAIVIAMVAVACDSAAEKPTAEPPTPVPTVSSQSLDADDNSAAGSGDTAAPTGGLRTGALQEPEVQECLAGELGVEVNSESGAFDRSLLQDIDPEDVTAAFEVCGVEQGGRAGPGGVVGSGIGDPQIRECLNDELGDDFLSQLGRGSGLGLDPESLAAFEKCGLDIGDASGGFSGFGGGGGRFGGDDGIFGGRAGGGFAGGTGDFQECITGLLGDDALSQLRNSGGAPSAELQDALAECSVGIAIPVEPDGGIGDGAGPILVEPEVEPTATSIPVSDLTIEQLTCLSDELDPADLASAVVATSSGDLSKISDEILAALQTCGVGA
jgi:hypothetical protein